MELVFDREKMLSTFSAAASVPSAKSPKQILESYVKLVAAPTGVSIWATDIELTLQAIVPEAQVVRGGEVLLPVDQMAQILRENTDEQMKIEYTGTLLTVSGRNSYQIPVPNADEYPDVLLTSIAPSHRVGAKTFLEVIRRSVFATETESGRYAMGGVLIEMHPEQLIAVATDGRRLAKVEVEAQCMEKTSAEVQTALVPKRAMDVLQRIITGGGDETLRIGTSQAAVGIEGSRFAFRAQQLEGRFPNWRDVLPRLKEENRLELVVEPLLAGIRQAAVVCDAENRGLLFQLSEGALKISAQSSSGAASHVELVVSYHGAPVEVSLDHRYVLEFLRVLDPLSVVTVYMPGPEAAVHFHTADKYLYIVMPMSRKK